MSTPLPKIIWTLWLQGWDSAPDLARASLASWRRANPGWRVHALDRSTLARFLSPEELADILVEEREIEALSNQVRIRLLQKYGGVWVDATTICVQPLDEWLPARMTSGFFAFARPGPDRLLSSWFMAAVKGSYIVEQWSRRVTEYWRGRSQRHIYYWFHGELLSNLHASDSHVRQLWDAAPTLVSRHKGHFGPDTPRLIESTGGELPALLTTPPSPVLKLTRKITDDRPADSLLDSIIKFGLGDGGAIAMSPSRRLLIIWSGSSGHGTVGNLRTLESAVTHLVGRGHEVVHATAHAFDIQGATRVDWRAADPADFDGVMFAGDPAPDFHPEAGALLEKFGGCRLLRVGMADENGAIAIAAQTPAPPPREHAEKRPVIGLAIGGHHVNRGAGADLSAEVATLADFAAARAIVARGGIAVRLETDLAMTGKTPDEIEISHAACDLIITSTIQGAIAAMRFGVPFIAIDPVLGGAKLHALLSGLGWKYVHRVEHVNAAVLDKAVSELLDIDARPRVLDMRDRCVMDANRALAAIDDWVASLPETAPDA